MFPFSASMSSLKFNTSEVKVLTLVAPSPGLEEVKVGFVASSAVN